MRWLYVFLSLCLVVAVARAAEDETSYWLTEDEDAVIALSTNENGVLSGKIVWHKEPAPGEDKSELDIHNPDPDLRGRKLLGLTILSGFEKESEKTWKGGTVYDPESGNTYYGKIEFKGDRMEMRGSLDKWGLLGRTAEFTRTTNPEDRKKGAK